MGTSPGALITCESLLPAPSPAGTARGVRSCCCTSQPCLSPPAVPSGSLWRALGGARGQKVPAPSTQRRGSEPSALPEQRCLPQGTVVVPRGATSPCCFPYLFSPSLFPREGRGGGRAKLGPPKGLKGSACSSHTLTPRRSGRPGPWETPAGLSSGR